jgi:hypothetical protein
MDNPALLRQTVRRCTAILVAAIALTGFILHPSGNGGLLRLIVLGALLYLGFDYFPIIESSQKTVENSAESSTADETQK